MQARYVIGAGAILGAFAVVAIIAYFSNQELYLTVDELVSDPALYAAADAGIADADFAGADDAAVLGSDADADVSDADAPASELADERLQVRGTVDYDSVQRTSEGLEMRFDLTGKDGRLPVLYEGMVPDTFEMAEEVTVAGHVARGGTFVADDLIVQCPSKYEAVPPGEEASHPEEVQLSDG